MKPSDQTTQTVVDGFIAVVVLLACIIGEGILLFRGLPPGIDQVIAGRVLGTLDAVGMIVINYYFGSSRQSRDQVNSLTSISQAAAGAAVNVTLPSGQIISAPAVAPEITKTQPAIVTNPNTNPTEPTA